MKVPVPSGFKVGEMGKEKPHVAWSKLKLAAIGVFKDTKAASQSDQAKAMTNAIGKGMKAGVEKVGNSNLN